MPRKYKYEEVKKIIEDKGYILENKEYKNNTSHITIIDNNGYKIYTNFANIQNNKIGKPFSHKNKYFIYNLKKILNNNKYPTKLKYNNFDYKSSKQKIELVCGICKKDFFMSWENIRDSKNIVCYECSKKISAKNKMLDRDYVFSEINKMGYKVLQEEYFGNKKPILLENKLGYRGYASYDNLKNRKGDLEIFNIKCNKTNYIYNANLMCKLNNIKTKVIDFDYEYKGSKQGLFCECECGEIFSSTIYLIKSNKYRCSKCAKSKSKFQNLVENWLNENEILYDTEFRFKDCKNKKPLPFDIMILNKNILIEIDGQQHFKPNSKFGGVEGFNTLKNNDSIKNLYCKNNNFKLVRISYKDFKNDLYKKILSNILLSSDD